MFVVEGSSARKIPARRSSAAVAGRPVRVVPAKASRPPLWTRQSPLLALLLLVATVSLYLPVRHHPFLNFDDNQYVTANPSVQNGLDWETVRWAFTTYHSFNWHPLTWLSHALDVEIFGMDPSGPHLVNAALHALNVLLLFWVLARATNRLGRSAMVAALFALHPINVESVAWIAERKNLLSMTFFLLALGAYRWYVQRPGVARYFVVALCFSCGLMAKPQVITLPLVLLLWDYWPLQRMAFGSDLPSTGKRFAWLVLEKTPLFALCAASAVLTMQAQQAGGAVASMMKYWLTVRVENALVAYMRYIGKAFWPTKLAPMYPHPGRNLPMWEVWTALILLLAITNLAFNQRGSRYLLVGWLWFLGTMVPMIGIVQVGHQAMADRYAYLPFIGLFLMVCWGVPDFLESHAHPQQQKAIAFGLAGVSAVLLLALALLSHRQIHYWSNNVALWSHVEKVIGPNSIAANRIGDELLQRGETEAAMQHFEQAVAIQPADADSNFAIAVYEQQRQNFPEAILHYQAVVGSNASIEMKIRALMYMADVDRKIGDLEGERECRERVERLRR
jgi:protein O-mannosyl-transferase